MQQRLFGSRAQRSILIRKYYSTPAEIYSGVVGAYDVLRKNSGGFENMIAMMNAGSDDHVAGGGRIF
ncbi:MAG: hypothetical protein U0T36_02940 [Saprospiraceae bacterium]